MNTKQILESPLAEGERTLGEPLNIRQAAKFLGLSVWTLRQVLIPSGLPYFRSGSSGKFVFYQDQLTNWILQKQQSGGRRG
jgi:hypothetical protein